jgi:hypothetical protein
MAVGVHEAGHACRVGGSGRWAGHCRLDACLGDSGSGHRSAYRQVRGRQSAVADWGVPGVLAAASAPGRVAPVDVFTAMAMVVPESDVDWERQSIVFDAGRCACTR